MKWNLLKPNQTSMIIFQNTSHAFMDLMRSNSRIILKKIMPDGIFF